MIGFHPFQEDHISPMVRQRFTCTTLSFMSYPFLLFIHFLHLARQHWQRRQEFFSFLQESNAPQQRKNSAKAYVLSFDGSTNWMSGWTNFDPQIAKY